MPHIAITMFPGRDEETKTRLAAKMQQCMVEELGVDADVVSVSIADVPQDKWSENIRSIDKNTMFIAPGYPVD